MKRESVEYEPGDILIHSTDGVEFNIIKVTRKAFSFNHSVIGRVIYTTDNKNEFLNFVIKEKLEFQCLKKHCVKL